VFRVAGASPSAPAYAAASADRPDFTSEDEIVDAPRGAGSVGRRAIGPDGGIVRRSAQRAEMFRMTPS
jgi:hypothetical protein